MNLPIDQDAEQMRHELSILRSQINSAMTLLGTPGMTVHDPDYCEAFRKRMQVQSADFIIGDFAIKVLKPHALPPVGKHEAP